MGGRTMQSFDLSVGYDGTYVYISNEDGSGAKYPVRNPKQVAFAVQEYIQNYCMKEATDENT